MLIYLEKNSTRLPNGCLVWNLGKNKQGYGKVRWRGKHHRVHKLGFDLRGGSYAQGPDLRHTCNNPSCWEDAHLVPGTPRDNASDKLGHTSKLTEQIIRDIRSSSESGVSLSKKHHVSQATVSMIRSKKVWAHIPD